MHSLAQYPFLKTCFWSYKLEDLDIDTHKTLIIKQILNHGQKAATTWLRTTYSAQDIATVIASSMESEWSKKSLALWSLVYNVQPQRHTRFV
jgi:hypothetical protein